MGVEHRRWQVREAPVRLFDQIDKVHVCLQRHSHRLPSGRERRNSGQRMVQDDAGLKGFCRNAVPAADRQFASAPQPLPGPIDEDTHRRG